LFADLVVTFPSYDRDDHDDREASESGVVIVANFVIVLPTAFS
jgi:hypothetical protein